MKWYVGVGWYTVHSPVVPNETKRVSTQTNIRYFTANDYRPNVPSTVPPTLPRAEANSMKATGAIMVLLHKHPNTPKKLWLSAWVLS